MNIGTILTTVSPVVWEELKNSLKKNHGKNVAVK